MKKLLSTLILVIVNLTAIYCQPTWALDGLVTSVHDGDSITIAGISQKIRIRNMDAPELANKSLGWGYQPYASEARTSLLNLCGGKIATLTNMKTDFYGRIDARVNCQGFDVATWQLDNGLAWPYHYNTPKKYKRMALDAKGKNLGLWVLPNATDPWAWRKNKMGLVK
jgi:endonuclease YncB( thermonuclease family)